MSTDSVKVMHLISTTEIGGAEIQLDRLLARINSPSLQHCVVSLSGIGLVGQTIHARGIPVYSLDIDRGGLSFSAAAGMWKLWKLLRREQPLVLQTWMYHADLLGLFLAKLCGIPFVFWNIRCAEMDMQHYPILTRIVLRILCWLSRVQEGVIVNSEAGRLAHSRMGYRPKVFEVIHNGFDLNHFRPDPFARDWFINEFDLPQNSIIIGHVARYDPMKDHKMFLSAARKVRAKHPNAYFVFCGKGMDEYNQAIVQMIEQYALQSSVRLLGLRQDISRVTAAFDIACSSSLGEGFSNTIGEAMASEVPCVVTDVGNSREIVGGAGIVVPARDAEAFAEALSELIACGHMTRKRLGMLCRARIANLFDIGHAADRYKNIYLACCSGGGSKQKAI